VWRARWMSLVTSTAFQVSPAVQARAFIVLGALATSDVDDDFFYQMLVALKTGLSQFSESDTVPVVSMLRCLRNVVPALPLNSRYLPQVFWLAVALLQSRHFGLYLEAAHLLRVTTDTLYSQGYFEDQGMVATLLEYRASIEEVASQVDALLGVSFEVSFSFSLATVVFTGMRRGLLRGAAIDTLRTLLRISARAVPKGSEDHPGLAIQYESLGFLLALLPASTDEGSYMQLLTDANVDSSYMPQDRFEPADQKHVPRVPLALLGITDQDTALFVISFLRTMIMSTQGDDAETEILFCLLSEVADAFPAVLAVACVAWLCI